MTHTDLRIRRRRRDRAGLSMVEIVTASMIMGGIVVVALQGIRTMRASQMDTADIARAKLLAIDLMSEIMQHGYEEPLETVEFGPEVTEQHAPPTRVDFDDIDDYKDWNNDEDIAPQDKDGNLLDLGVGWQRTADVDFVKADDLSRLDGNDTGVKRVIVRVLRNGKELAILVGTMSRYWQAPPYD